MLYLKETKVEDSKTSLDYMGALTITSAIVLFVYGVSMTETVGWMSYQTLYTLLGVLALLVLFILIEVFFAKEQLVPLSLFKSRSVSGANIVAFLLYSGLMTMSFFNTLWLQTVLGMNAVDTGLAFLPSTVAIAIFSAVASKLVQRFGARNVLLVGGIITSSGLFWLSNIKSTDTWVSKNKYYQSEINAYIIYTSIIIINILIAIRYVSTLSN